VVPPAGSAARLANAGRTRYRVRSDLSESVAFRSSRNQSNETLINQVFEASSDASGDAQRLLVLAERSKDDAEPQA